jgi:tripartite-type tricarboxylate transporter receptor subunit TctC
MRFVVPFPPGGTIDVVARAMKEPLSHAFGQSVVVQNRPGANMIIGAELVARAPADGHTVLVGGTALMAALRTNLPFDPLRDFAAVARVGTQPFVLSVHPSLPAKSVTELVAFSRAHPGELVYATNGYGTMGHLAGELLMLRTRIRMKHVAFQGSAPSVMAVIGGHVSIVVSGIAPIVDHIAAGRLRALAVTSRKRSATLNDVPTMMESGVPDFDISVGIAIMAPAATPKVAVHRLSAEIVRVVRLSQVEASLRRIGFDIDPTGAAELDADIRTRVEKMKQLARAANIRVD